MREEFEKLPEIIEYLKDAEWSELTQRYIAKRVNHYRTATFMNGAWYAYQEQQKKIDEHNAKLQKFIDELTKTEQDDKDNKIEFWRGFAECAGSVRDVFLRDVGELK